MAQQPFPFTLANLPAGNNPVADIDADFNVVVRGPSVTVAGHFLYWDNTAGTSANAGVVSNPAIGTITALVGLDGSGKLPAVDASNLLNIPVGVIRTYLSGLTLSNDGGSPNTVLDVSAGVCADSTNAVTIALGAFTKSTAGSWVAGTGANGMGAGLTIANNTWYSVFAIINTTQADVYFDTSVTAANAPVGTTAFRRIGSFLTDGSAHIIAFVQQGSYFAWSTAVLDVNDTNPGTSAVLKTLASVPVGVNVFARLNIKPTWFSNGSGVLFVSDPATSDQAPSNTAAPLGTGGAVSGTNGFTSGGYQEVRTNTSAQIRYRLSASGAADVVRMATLGWIDPRGQNA